ncbi:MAG: LapA family protein [Actinomycetota bacterium]|nr:LapA family protein [Actinomycetota bacterium]
MAPHDGSRRFPFTKRQVAGLVLIVLAVIFILENRASTTIRFLLPQISAPLWVALLMSALAGVLAGALLTSRRDR